jgi:hypothetical protein
MRPPLHASSRSCSAGNHRKISAADFWRLRVWAKITSGFCVLLSLRERKNITRSVMSTDVIPDDILMGQPSAEINLGAAGTASNLNQTSFVGLPNAPRVVGATCRLSVASGRLARRCVGPTCFRQAELLAQPLPHLPGPHHQLEPWECLTTVPVACSNSLGQSASVQTSADRISDHDTNSSS